MDSRKRKKYYRLNKLPDEMLINIFSFFNYRELNKMSEVSKKFYHIARDESFKRYPLLDYKNPILAKIEINKNDCNHITMLSDTLVISCGSKKINIIDVKTGDYIISFSEVSNARDLVDPIHKNSYVQGFAKLTEQDIAVLYSNQINILNYKTGHLAQISKSDNRMYYYDYKCIAVLSDDLLVVGQGLGMWSILNYKTNAWIRDIQSKSYSTTCCVAALPNKHLASGHMDGKLRIWNYQTGKHVRTLHSSDISHKSEIRCISVLSNEQLASGYSDGKIKIWNYQTGKCLQTIKDEANNVDHAIWENYAKKLYITQLPNKQLICAYSYGKLIILDYQYKTYNKIFDGSANNMDIDIFGCTVLNGNQILIARKSGLEILSFPPLKKENKECKKEPEKKSCLVM